MKNSTLKGVAETILDAKKILIMAHASPDGDALGSAVSLCYAILALGKEAKVLLEEKDEVADDIAFLLNENCIISEDAFPNYDLCISVDCADLKRLKNREIIFSSAKKSINIDHHESDHYFGDINYVIPNATATSEIIFELVNELNVLIDKNIATGIYVGIVTDTGNFQNANTNSKAHEIVADIMDKMDVHKVNKYLYQSIPREQLIIESKACSEIEFYKKGKIAVTIVTLEMLENINANDTHTKDIVTKLRNIKDVEVGIFLREKSPDNIKCSLRSKKGTHVDNIAKKYGGGGHKHAAGFDYRDGDIFELKKKIIMDFENLIKE